MPVAAVLQQHLGEVVEWLMALVLKTSEVKASAGSNPALSVSGSKTGIRQCSHEVPLIPVASRQNPGK